MTNAERIEELEQELFVRSENYQYQRDRADALSTKCDKLEQELAEARDEIHKTNEIALDYARERDSALKELAEAHKWNSECATKAEKSLDQAESALAQVGGVEGGGYHGGM